MPLAFCASGMAMPQATSRARTQLGQHAPASQVAPPVQREPCPGHAIPPMQVAGMSVPQSTSSAAKHWSVQAQVPSTQDSLSAVQGPSQSPPQPSSAPQMAPSAQFGMQSQTPVSGLHSSLSASQVPGQKPPQASSAPQTAFGAQLGTQTHSLAMHRAGGSHAGSHAQVSTHDPF